MPLADSSITAISATRRSVSSPLVTISRQKLTARYDFTPEFAIRGTVSNGFRAPTLAEEYYSATNCGISGCSVTLPPDSPGGKLLGLGNGLQPEKSVNYSLGFVFRPLPAMSMTLDLYQITVTNRIVGTGEILGQVNGVPTAATMVELSVAVRLTVLAVMPVLPSPLIKAWMVAPMLFSASVPIVTRTL